MGISKLVAGNSLVLLCVTYLSSRVLPSLLVLPLLQSTIVGFLVATCSHPTINYTHLFGKSETGIIPWWSYLLFYPYISLAQGYVYARRKKAINTTREPPYSEVSEGIFVGSWPHEPQHIPNGHPAIVDCTCELPKSECLKGLPYLCIPIWDSRSPTLEDITRAVTWAAQMRQKGRPIFVHCAFGA